MNPDTASMRLRIADNGRYFIDPDGSPFVWIADTAWTLPQRIMWQDVDYYLQLRKAQGFTVIQIVALDPERDVQMRDPAGNPALYDADPTKPNEAYFHHLDRVIDTAASYGLHVLLLPAWGQLVVGDNWMGQTFDRTLTVDNAYTYGEWIGLRYRDRDNVIWCMGGDRMPVHKDVDYRPVWRALAEGVAHGVTGQRLHWNVPDPLWQEIPMTYHPCHENETGRCSTMSYWTDDEAWISFIMLQSGHNANIRSWELVENEYDRASIARRNDTGNAARIMPVWDGEPAYEMMPTSFPEFTDFHGPWMVRRRAYWSLFAGAFGFTYGHCSVWSSIGERERDPMFQQTWFEAIHSPGAAQMQHMHALIEDLQLMTFQPCQELITENTEDLTTHVQACVSPDGATTCTYLPSGGDVAIDLAVLTGISARSGVHSDADVVNTIGCWWFNPRNGMLVADESHTIDGNGTLHTSSPDSGPEHDWILLTTADGTRPPIATHSYGDRPCRPSTVTKVFDWGE